MADPALTEEPKVSKRAAEKAAKKAAAKAKKDTFKAEQPKSDPATRVVDPNAKFKEGWLRGVYNEKPVNDVHTRFPPEPNGYLHIGHAKAITVNFGFAKAYDGVCNLRFDDTNPAKEEERYFTSIKEMVSWLGFSPHKITYSSDQFDELYRLAEELIKKDKAYVCFCSPEEVLAKRGGKKGDAGPRSACEHWSYPVEKSLEEFRAMRNGKYQQGEALLRMKMFLATKPEEYELQDDDSAEVKSSKRKLKTLAENPAMWDVAAYRIKRENYHHRTGDKWRIYPTYEFTHCICDSLEGITHSLCTVEFETLRPAYNWLLEQIDHKAPASEEKGPMQREYGRLNVEGTILSKRRIQMLVEGCTVPAGAQKPKTELSEATEQMNLAEEGEEDPEEEEAPSKPADGTGRKVPPVVRDWDDPRLFTLVALRRRGVPPGALKKFVLDLGVTKAYADVKMHILDASVRTYLERTVPRLLLVLDPIKVTIENVPDDYLEERDVPFDPKDPSKGTHKVPFTKTIYIDRDDFREVDDPDFFRLAPGKSVGLLYIDHPIRAKSFTKGDDGKVDEIIAEYGAEVPAGKARIHWVGESSAHKSPYKAEVRVTNALFKNPRPNELDWKTGGYYDNINPDSEIIYPNALIENGFDEIRKNAPWPKEEGEAEGTTGNYSVRFQGLRTAFFALDKEATDDKIILNRIVSLKEDTGKK
ncbi:glutamine--tRNA ligase-like protein [Elsinoe australis]|uniref:glutamine--tRNA ligase n=1 Tax=Elsinoe australis TaxID=40998 RepID=A0A4U7AWQ5_9PEZI|nr:glutamine--tRNA ligase-like protein [Elsinoe australis]